MYLRIGSALCNFPTWEHPRQKSYSSLLPQMLDCQLELTVCTYMCIDSLRPGWSRDQILVLARFSAPVQTITRAHPASYNGSGSFRRVKWLGLALTTHSHVVPMLKKDQRSTSPLPLCAFMASYRVSFIFALLLHICIQTNLFIFFSD